LSVRERSYELERQDKSPEAGRYTLEEFVGTMETLADINTVDKAGYNATLKVFDRLKDKPRKIIEIGFGRGDFSILLAERYPQADVVGVDAHNLSVYFANLNYDNYIAHNDKQFPNLHFEHREVEDMVQQEDSFDVVTTTLVNHHIFPDESFIEFLKYVRRVGKVAFIFNDLNRSPQCYIQTFIGLNIIRYIGSKIFLPVVNILSVMCPAIEFFDFTRRYLSVLYDKPGLDMIIDSGILSMARAFSRSELDMMFQRAGYPADALHCEEYATSCRYVCYADLSY
jgi:2-polyprenyl-3-methyl-5-hydroxy-6-metoxy-1,4-benzoquinol methylase